MNYEEALKTAYKILSASWNETSPLCVRDTYDANKNVTDEVARKIADELVKAWDFGYSCSEYDNTLRIDDGY